jgi:hypothetical protein
MQWKVSKDERIEIFLSVLWLLLLAHFHPRSNSNCMLKELQKPGQH